MCKRVRVVRIVKVGNAFDRGLLLTQLTDNIISAPAPRKPTVATQKPKQQSKPKLVAGTATEQTGSAGDAFGDRIKGVERKQQSSKAEDNSSIRRTGGGGMEMVFTPKTTEADDHKPAPKKAKGREQFGHGLEKGALEQEQGTDEGRSRRRKNLRMASNNVLRR